MTKLKYVIYQKIKIKSSWKIIIKDNNSKTKILCEFDIHLKSIDDVSKNKNKHELNIRFLSRNDC